jgi:glycine/D-amino acid oxidase-like deaminating enzyme/nitrite reductase/ring-hydroxylating ferredoxin subunit
MSESRGTKSFWQQTDDRPRPPSLLEDTTAKVCIVGAGIAGLTTAYLLNQAGHSVIVLDDGPIAGGETGRTTAHLSNAIDRRYSSIEWLHGEKGARLAAESHSKAIDAIERIVAAEGIDCDFERLNGYLFATPGESTQVLQGELEAARRAGLLEVSLLPRAPLDWFNTGPCLCFPNQAQFHPLKYLTALAAAIVQRGGRIFTGTHATKIEGGPGASVQTNGPTVRSEFVVVATNTPVNDLVAIHTKQAAYRSYVVAACIPRASVTRALYWDTSDPYHYLRIHRHSVQGKDLLLIGGEDHKTGQADDTAQRFRRLEEWAKERFPMIESFDYHWSGQVMESIDGLAYIGANPMDAPNVFVATGDCGMGMTHGTIAGILLTELIQGHEHPWKPLYDPSRITARAIGDFARETVNMGAQYTEWLTPGTARRTDDIPPGSGAIVRRGLSKVAVYRHSNGSLEEFSAVCPHLGGIVGWNSTEKTWDCPCHGSRFDVSGRVLNGPAIGGLEPATERASERDEGFRRRKNAS